MFGSKKVLWFVLGLTFISSLNAGEVNSAAAAAEEPQHRRNILVFNDTGYRQTIFVSGDNCRLRYDIDPNKFEVFPVTVGNSSICVDISFEITDAGIKGTHVGVYPPGKKIIISEVIKQKVFSDERKSLFDEAKMPAAASAAALQEDPLDQELEEAPSCTKRAIAMVNRGASVLVRDAGAELLKGATATLSGGVAGALGGGVTGAIGGALTAAALERSVAAIPLIPDYAARGVAGLRRAAAAVPSAAILGGGAVAILGGGAPGIAVGALAGAVIGKWKVSQEQKALAVGVLAVVAAGIENYMKKPTYPSHYRSGWDR